MSKAKVIDLSDMLGKPKGTHEISLDDLIPAPRKAKEPLEVVLFWTEHSCKCGRHYEQPTYGDTLTRYAVYKFGKLTHHQYEHYLPANHADLPRRVETRHIYLHHCPICIHESNLHQDQQLDLFGETA